MPPLLPALVAIAFPSTSPPPIAFAKPRLLTSGFAAAPRTPMIADLDGDGFGDLIAVDMNMGVVDVARSVRGGKFLGPVNAASGLGTILAASSRAGANGRAEIVLDRSDGAGRKIVAFAAEQTWSVRDEPMPGITASPAAPPNTIVGNLTGERRIAGDFDGDGAEDTIIGTHLVLAADPSHPQELPLIASLPASAVVVAGDISGDHRADLVVFRREDTWRTGQDVLAYVMYREGDADADGDGLDRATEERLKSDPLDADTDHDGLLDGWEVRGEGALDLPALGASPTHKDCFVYVQRYSETDGAHCAREMARVVKTWAELPNGNPDGTTGIALHPIWLPPLPPGTPGRSWWDLGNENLPRTARGLAHYMEINAGGGGQAAELGEMGGCGAGAFWACFLHEFGHQLGLSHAGGPLSGMCPTYTSLMSYAYSYGFNDDGNQIHYSNGAMASLMLNETHLTERLTLALDKVAFLAKGPYRFKLQADGETTLIDWNRNGQFDEGVVRADIDDVYGVGSGRFAVGKTVFAPVLFDHRGRLFLVGANRDKRLYRREIQGADQFAPETWLDAVKPTGDPTAIDDGQTVLLLVPTEDGIVALSAPEPEGLETATPQLLPDSKGLSVSATFFRGRALVLLWKDEESPITFVTRDAAGAFSAPQPLATVRSTIPPGAAEDPATHELVLGIGVKETVNKAERGVWRVVRLRSDDESGTFTEASSRAVGGEGAGWYGNARPILLIESGPSATSDGRLHFIGRGFAGPPNFNCCTYEAITIGDVTQNDGWRLRRYCDEWSTTRSPIGACFHGGDMTIAYRWFGNVHGDEDDDVHILPHGFGITDADMHDFDDVSEIADIGLERSILWRDPAAK
jgi:hypothetical protein